MANIYDVGDVVKYECEFTDASGTPHDPGSVFFARKSPSDVLETYQHGEGVEIVKESVGNYYIELAVGASGYWYHRWYSEDPGKAAGEGSVFVKPTKVA